MSAAGSHRSSRSYLLHYAVDLICVLQEILPALPLCSPDCIVVRVLAWLQGESSDALMPINPLWLSELLALGCHLRHPPVFSACYDTQLGGMAVQYTRQACLQPLYIFFYLLNATSLLEYFSACRLLFSGSLYFLLFLL